MADESIDKILNELQKVGVKLEEFQQSGIIPDIERDIVLSKLRNIYEFIQLIQLQAVEQPAQPAQATRPPVQKEYTEEVQALFKKEEMAILEIESEMMQTPSAEMKHEEPTEKMKVQSEEADISQPVTKKPEPATTILAEKFQQDKSFLNEALAKFQNMQDVARKYQTKPIKDISSAISLNDKFLYIKELFNNDGDLYKKTIEILNNSGDFNRAVQYLDEHFQWDFNDFQVQKILELTHRRYMPADE